MRGEQANDLDAIIYSNVHSYDPMNALHATHKEEKDQNVWPIIEIIPEPINAQEWETHADFPNSCNDVDSSHDSQTDSIEDNPSEVDSSGHTPPLNNITAPIQSLVMFYFVLII